MSGLPYWLGDFVGHSAMATALTYQRHDVSIFPCHTFGSKAKAPHTRHGWHDASADEAQIRLWWRSWGQALIGLPCCANGIIALDADCHGGEDGIAVLLRLFDRYQFDPNTVPCVITPRGRHYIFRRPQTLGPTVANVANGIDVRDFGYIIAAGSLTGDGKPYSLVGATVDELAWAIGHDALPELPQPLVNRIAKPVAASAPFERSILAISPQPAKPQLSGLIRTVAAAEIGRRNSLLYWASCRAGELIRTGAISAGAAEAMLTEAAAHAGLKSAETLATIRSGLRRGGAHLGHG